MAGRYAEVVRQIQSRPQWLALPRIPAQDRYLRILDEAVRSALLAGQDPQSTLDEVARQWSTVTAEQGVDEQREAYHRSLGL